MIEGTYTGLAGAGSGNDAETTNSPPAKLSNGGWSVHRSDFWATPMGNLVIVGTNTTSGYHEGAVISPEEAWNIDKKVDDGLPQTGKVLANENLSAADDTGCSNTTTDTYSLSNSGVECSLVFRMD